LLLDGRHGGLGGGREFSAGESGTADLGGDAKGAGDLGERHVLEVIVAKGFEEALCGGEEFLGSVPLLFAKALEAGGPIGGLFALPIGEVGGLLLEEA
jgi:hypothetical protein